MTTGLEIRCTTCGRAKAPRGRDVPAGMHETYCTTTTCADYGAEPRPGFLWPGEIDVNLMPCPMCQGAAELAEESQGWVARCRYRQCGCRSRLCATEAAALYAWNPRMNDPAVEIRGHQRASAAAGARATTSEAALWRTQAELAAVTAKLWTREAQIEAVQLQRTSLAHRIRHLEIDDGAAAVREDAARIVEGAPEGEEQETIDVQASRLPARRE